MKSSQVQYGLILLTVLLLGLSMIGAHHLYDQPLHHVPTTLGILALFFAARKQILSNGAALAIQSFIWLHILGARYIYSFVPYDEWCLAYFGGFLSEHFSWQRNHYDRFVHFAYGTLATFPQTELLVRRCGLPLAAALAISFSLVMACSAIYEILEWLLAVIAAPDWAERYNGQQGDAWDAQKDMALASVGAIVTSAAILIATIRRK